MLCQQFLQYRKENMEAKAPYFAAIAIQFIYAGTVLLSKVAFDEGMNTFVFVFYRQAAGTLVLTPIALFLEWKNSPPLSFVTICKIFLLSLFGITLSLNLINVGLEYTTASLGGAITNTLPVFTFFIALLLRMEKVKLKSASGVATVTGIAFFIAGAVTIAFYRGPHLNFLPHHRLIGHNNLSSKHGDQEPSRHRWILGCFFMLLCNTTWASWLIFQGKVLKSYPSKLLFTSLQSFFSAIQCFVLAIAVERDFHQWKLGWNIRLLSVVYCGVMVSAVAYALQTWVIEKKGAVFLAMPTPLAYITTIIASSLLLGEIITFGSVIGGVLLVGGLYSVLWGKSRLIKTANKECDLIIEVEQQCIENQIIQPKDDTKAVG